MIERSSPEFQENTRLNFVTSVKTLMVLAKDVGNAKKEGDPEKIQHAEAKLKAYEKLCLESDKMIIDC